MSTLYHALQENKFLLLDGAMGTMLQGAGLPAGQSPEQFCLENPHILHSIHTAYVQAGANILTTCTFGGNAHKLPKGIDVVHYNARMAQVARAAASQSDGRADGRAGRRVLVAGNIGPTGLFVRPLGEIEPLALVQTYAEQVRGLVQGGVDCIFIETHFDISEIRAAVVATRQICDLPIIVSMTFEHGVSLTGSTPEIFAETVQNLDVTVLGTNCSAGPEQMAPVVEELLAYARIPVMVEPNAGLPELIDGRTVFRLSPEVFAQKTAAFAAAGVQILGGCCGTTPAHIAALRATIENMPYRRPQHRSGHRSGQGGIVLTTRTELVRIGEESSLTIIGERINPTGKKQLTAELQAGKFDMALAYADAQIADGALVLDVNVGAPLVDEAELLPELILRLTSRCQTPLSLDSSNMDAISRALPYCPASSLVNSISGEAGRMETLGPLCRQWGAPFIILPLRGRHVPVMAAERIAIIESILEHAASLGIPRRLMMVDVLALAVSSKAEAGKQCLETIRWCVREGLPTTIGLSNISFGLPARDLLNATFLALAMGAGLTSCIANPAHARLREVRDAGDALLQRDKNAARFIAYYAQWNSAQTESHTMQTSVHHATSRTVEEAVLRGDKENVTRLVEAHLADGNDPLHIVQERLIPAITEVGARYERREYFLPQLIRSAETMQTAFARLQPLLDAQQGEQHNPAIVLATVEGDIHDIGKNIVALLLGNHGFTIIDAGKDVKAEAIVDCAVEHNASIIGLSALMTTTMVRMEDTVRLVQERGLPIKVMVGGAVVTEAFAASIGAHGYSPDAVSAVRLAKSLL